MFTQNTPKPEKMPIIDTITPINLKLSAMFKRSFAYFTVKERIPIIITKIIDQLSRDREDITQHYGPSSEPDVRAAMSYLVHLRNELMTNKPMEYLTADVPDVKMWNNLIKEQNHPYYFTAVWLFTECYVYRRIKEAFELTAELKTFDPFRKQKEQQFNDSVESMCYVADHMVSTWLAIGGGAKMSEYFQSLLKVCLWSNKCDLSLSAGADVAQKQNPILCIESWNENIVINDFDKLFMSLRNAALVMQQFKEFRAQTETKERRDEEHRKHEAGRNQPGISKYQNTNSSLPQASADEVIVHFVTPDSKVEHQGPAVGKADEKNTAVTKESTTEDQIDIIHSSTVVLHDRQVPESDEPIDSEPDTVNASVPSPKVNADLETGSTQHRYESPVTSINNSEMEDPVKFKDSLTHVKIDIVCDNAGYELFADLCFADFLITKGFCSKIRFRLKAYPWFVSDATLRDFEWIINSCGTVQFSKLIGKLGTKFTYDKSSSSADAKKKKADRGVGNYLKSDNLIKLGLRWKKYLDDGIFEPIVDEFWTTPHDFSQMRKVDPFLYQSLGDAIFVFFKGDLNYRKLMGENNWNPTTSFTKALQGFHPTPLCSIRTVKADLICGLKEGEMAQMIAKDEKWMETGNYGLIQMCNKVSRITPEELEPDNEDT